MKLPIINIPVRFPKWVFSWVLLVCDSFMGFLVFYSEIKPRFNITGDSFNDIELIFLTIQFCWCVLFYFNRLYQGEYTISRLSELVRLARLIALVIGSIIIFEAIGIIPDLIIPVTIFRYGVLFCLFTTCNRIVLRSIQKWLLEKGIGRENTVIIGANQRGKKAAQFFYDHHAQGFNILGFITLDKEPNNFDNQTEVLGHIDDIVNIINKRNISDAVLALEDNQRSKLFPIIQKLDPLPITVKVIPDLYEVISGIARTQQISGLPLIDINLHLDTEYLRVYKPVFDFFFSLFGLIITAPFWIIIALVIKVDSKGPILYKQRRIGRHNTFFTAFKFRSMIADAEKDTGPVWAGKNDARNTRAGAWLRRFRLDEFPQLLNVLKGEMSLVGPRPERPFFVEKLEKEYPLYSRRLKIRPGITGWAQIKHGYDENLEDVREKLKYDFYYIENVDIWLDIKILLTTIRVIVSGKGR